jgi:hypothetical protein
LKRTRKHYLGLGEKGRERGEKKREKEGKKNGEEGESV